MKKSLGILLILGLLFWFLDAQGSFNWLHRSFGKLTNKGREDVLLLTRKEEDEDPEIKIADLRFRVSQLEEENKSIRRLLGADLSPKLKFIPAHIMGVSRDSFVLDQGSFGGILKDSLVLSENTLVGKIVKANSFNSQGFFLTNNDFRLAVGIWREKEGEKNLIGKGLLRGGVNLIVGEILPEEMVQEEDLVASLEQGGEFLIGKVVKVDWDQGKVFKKAEIKGFVNLRNLRTVMVVKQ